MAPTVPGDSTEDHDTYVAPWERSQLEGGGGPKRSEADPPLENTANNSSPRTPDRDEKRRRRWRLRSVAWKTSTLQRVRHCGRVPRSTSTGITARRSEIGAGFAGLQHCGSVWSCPVCSAQILTQRALEIGSVLGRAVDAGHSLGFITLTMRHRRSQPLSSLWTAAAHAWAAATSGKLWQRQAAAHGVEGWVRVWEVTHGRNGWHVHVHLVVVLAPGAGQEDLDAVAGGLYGRWSRSLVRSGLEAPRLVGQDWHLVGGDQAAGQLAEYLFKLTEQAAGGARSARSLGLELAHSMPGRARADLATEPVWSLLSDFAETGDAESLRRWHEWERGSKGRRQVAWSKLRERFAPDLDDQGDEEIANREWGTAADDVARISLDGWRRLVAIPDGPVTVLEALEGGGTSAMCDVLDRLEIDYELLRADRC